MDSCPLLDVYAAGVLIGSRPAVNFPSGATVADNPATDAVDITPSGFAPTPHDNTDHTNQYLDGFQPVGSLYAAADQAVSAAAVVTLATMTLNVSAGNVSYFIPLGAILNYRPGTILVPGIVDVWVDVGGTQRSAKFPVYVDPAQLQRIPLTLPLAINSLGNLTYWSGAHGAGAYVVSLKAQRRASADPPGSTVLCSDVAFVVVLITNDIP